MEVVGKIQGYDVVYIPQKHLFFFKNTAIPSKEIVEILKSKEQKIYIPAKKLWITKDSDIISFGCITTTIDNINNISKQIIKCQKK